MNTSFTDKPKSKPSSSDIVSTFIRKTYEMLEDQRFPDIVDWNAEGTAIVIKMPIEFGAKVLPTYFKHNNLTSFVRQLNMYNFHKRRTQKYDHVYSHDLFQKDKKFLLKEIRRKNQENSLANIQKAIEVLETVQSVQNQDATTNLYENQLLKKINKDALSRISMLENQVKDLRIQNQALNSQIAHQKQKEDILVSFLADSMKKKGITLDELPKVLNNQFNLPNLFTPCENALPVKDLGFAGLGKAGSGCFTNFLSFGDDCSNSTEVTPSSPLSKDNERKLSENLTFLSEMSDDLQNKSPLSIPENPMNGNNNYSQERWEFKGQELLGKRNGGAMIEENLNKMVKREPSQGMMNSFMFNGDGLKIKKYESFGDMFLGNDMMVTNTALDLMDF